MMDAATLRAVLPEFSNTTTYPDAAVNYWIGEAVKQMDAGRWGALLDRGILFFAAHNLSLGMMSQKEGATGNQPGMTRGALASGGVDKTSFAFNSTDVTDPAAGDYNLTSYGLRYWKLVKLVGAGPVFVGVDSGAADPLNSYNAYQGPYTGGW